MKARGQVEARLQPPPAKQPKSFHMHLRRAFLEQEWLHRVAIWHRVAR